MKRIDIYDSTLRDGAQALGISFTVVDKLKIVERLDYLGVSYIEAGNPGSNPKDLEFFKEVQKLNLSASKIIAFGSTRRPGIKVTEDANVSSLLSAETEAVAIFGKSIDNQVTEILKTTLDENLDMIYDTISFFKRNGKKVVFDAEHFFDGYRLNEKYALETLRAAKEAGADSLCLCDTKGSSMPLDIYNITQKIVGMFDTPIGIHSHNDNGMAVACSISAVQAGALQVQGTINGFGERCGNANLCTIIPNLQILMNYDCINPGSLHELTPIARFISEVANVVHDERAPYVGSTAFAHKAGMHADAVNKSTSSYENFDPELVGNHRRFLMSEVAGRGAILKMINRVQQGITKDSRETVLILEKMKEMEHEGYQYEGAEGSLELMVMKILGKYRSFFELGEFKVIINEPSIDRYNSTAMIKIKVGDEEEITAADGDGPVNALDKALRKALERFYPQLAAVRLTDYKVRVLDSESATAAKVRVLIESTDSNRTWSTIGVSSDVIEASWRALMDSVEYKLLKDMGV